MDGPSFPLRDGSVQDFQTVREFLQSAGYSESRFFSHFGLDKLHYLLYPYGMQADLFKKKYYQAGTFPLLARVLMGGFPATQPELLGVMGEPVLSAFVKLGILRDVPEDTSQWEAPVILYPAFDLFIASDRGIQGEKQGYRDRDYVMSGTENICRQYIDCFAKTPCRSLLDMGTGSGLAALLATGFAEQVCAIDITPRAVRYAEFNRKLNNRDNISILQGDLFGPVRGRIFDRIISNPPFEPPLKQDLVFSVGGADGEAILERLFAEAPAHLTSGGRLYCLVLGTDREDESFDQRLVRYLGEAAAECDLLLFPRKTMEPEAYAIEQILGENADAWKLQEWKVFYHKLKATKVIFGHAIVQRRDSDREVFRVRRDLGLDSGLKEMEWLLDWETRAASPAIEELLLSSRPSMNPELELHVRHGARDGELTPLSYTFFTRYPFEVNLHSAAWMAMVTARANGQRTGAELLSQIQSKLEVPKGEFLRALSALISAGFLHIVEFPPPARPESSKESV
jgi:methylase of polypeptide subunit release factors